MSLKTHILLCHPQPCSSFPLSKDKAMVSATERANGFPKFQRPEQADHRLAWIFPRTPFPPRTPFLPEPSPGIAPLTSPSSLHLCSCCPCGGLCFMAPSSRKTSRVPLASQLPCDIGSSALEPLLTLEVLCPAWEL